MESPAERKIPDPDKEPLRTGHSSHADFMEGLRIGRVSKGFGHGIPILVQAGVYLALIVALTVALIYYLGR